MAHHCSTRSTTRESPRPVRVDLAGRDHRERRGRCADTHRADPRRLVRGGRASAPDLRTRRLPRHHDPRRAVRRRGARSPGVGDEAVTTLQIAGLLTRPSRGVVAAGSVSLDAIAAAHDTDAARQKRITHYQAVPSASNGGPGWLATSLITSPRQAQAAAQRPGRRPRRGARILDLCDDPRPPTTTPTPAPTTTLAAARRPRHTRRADHPHSRRLIERPARSWWAR